MLKDAGATAVILGHSEHLRIHNETDALVAARALGLSTIICIREAKEHRGPGQALTACGGQVAASLLDLPAGHGTSVAYEPLWAIGSSHTAADEDIAAVHTHIRFCLVGRFDDAGQAVRILYGASVTSSIARAVLGLPDVGGVLIGGASLTAADFNAALGVAPALASTPDALAAE